MASGDTVITVRGNLTAPPELRYLTSGVPVVNLTIASTPRKFDKNTDSWIDEETLFLRASAFRDLAENCAESLDRGTAVIAVGRLKSRTFDTKEGDKRTVMELELDGIGPDLLRATAKVSRTQRGAGNGGQGNSNQSRPAASSAPADDPWATNSGQSDSVPF